MNRFVLTMVKNHYKLTYISLVILFTALCVSLLAVGLRLFTHNYGFSFLDEIIVIAVLLVADFWGGHCHTAVEQAYLFYCKQNGGDNCDNEQEE